MLFEKIYKSRRGRVKKNKSEIFKNWREEQVIFEQVSVETMKKKVGKKGIERLRRKLNTMIVDISSMTNFFHVTEVPEFFEKFSVPSVDEFKKLFSQIYVLLEGDIGAFVAHLKKNGFANKKLNAREKKRGIDAVVKKYNDWYKILFDLEDEEERDEFLFSIANKFFEFCFSKETFPQFKKILSNPEYHSIARMFYSIIWTNLSEVGWQHWHIDSLCALKKEADSGKEVLYIAGGTDIYQLIKSGIYNIRVIDPMLPTQPKYYSDGWEWFIKGDDKKFGVGEEVMFSCGKRKICMRRASYKTTGGSFSLKLSDGKKVKIDKSITTWYLFEGKKKLGEIIFERRLTNQDDFKVKRNQVILLSSNELYFIAAPKSSDGWGINPHKFDDKIKIYIKQLQKTVNKNMVCNIRYEVKQEEFAFISLGSCVD
jgi:hypothetical protein